MTPLRTGGGRAIVVGREVAAGGEGRVYEIAGAPAEVVKLYHSTPSPGTVAKLRALVGMRTNDLASAAAWPTDVVVEPGGACRGFVMPRIAARCVIDRLSHPGERRQHFAEADYLFVTTVAVNLMTAAARLHRNGVVIGDVNESNAMVYPNATVAFIDVDSFQVSAGGVIHRCSVAKDLFIPPELVGSNFATTNRVPSHDCFGLAVLVFQLLMHGRHPFHGRALDGIDRSTTDAIRAGAYAYSPLARVRIQAPPGSMDVATLGALAPLFERAFLTDRRPTAEEWVNALGQFKTGLKPCKSNERHAIFPGSGSCTICVLPRDPLPAPLAGPGGSSPDGGSVRQLLAEIGRLSVPLSSPPSIAEPPVTAAERECPTLPGESAPLAVATAASSGFPVVSLFIGISLGIAAILLSSLPRPGGAVWLVGGIAVMTLLGAFAQLQSWFKARGSLELAPVYEARRRAYASELASLDAAERAATAAWAGRASLVARVQRLKAAAAELAATDQRVATGISAKAAHQFRERWLHDQLDAFMISGASISGIGIERTRVLASHGIETAADVNVRDVRSVPGFGPSLTDALMAWRNKCSQIVGKRALPAMPNSFIQLLLHEHSLQLSKSAIGMAEEYRSVTALIREQDLRGSQYASAVATARAAYRQARQKALAIVAPVNP